ncbi:hypothetical protein [Streptomyces sedi]|uniref:Uncharacterized protein n=1 Tax=Streptomyces sedi TaxID=555059 RepID=A0A5C4V8V8_9ACTN|nr:hypothetical protein [Streptomyces sedi]TNM32211.1 hypothetical protein FH715_07375 [Streptomyces sedi]
MSEQSEEAAGRRWSKRRLAAVAAVTAGATAAVVIASTSHAEPDRSHAPVAEDEVPRTEKDVVEALEELLPEGVETSDAEGQGVDEYWEVTASLLAEDESAGAPVDLAAGQRGVEDWRDEAGCTGMVDEFDYVFCEETELPDGGVLSYWTWEPRGEETDEPEPGKWEAVWNGPGGEADGYQTLRTVRVAERYPEGNDAPGPDEMPVSVDELAEVAQAPVWQQVLDLVEEEWGPPDAPNEPPEDDPYPGEELRDTFLSLAPDEVEVTDLDSEWPGVADLVADDGEGPGMVRVEAGGPMPGSSAAEAAGGGTSAGSASATGADDARCTASELEDGSTLSLCEKEATEDTPLAYSGATLSYPDEGGSIALTAYNRAGENERPSRDGTPLSSEELGDIAVADEWRELIG